MVAIEIAGKTLLAHVPVTSGRSCFNLIRNK